MRTSFLGAAITAGLLASSFASAQTAVYNNDDPDRHASTVFAFGNNAALIAASISYSQPTWKKEYDTMLDSLKGKKARLGKNWWTTLTTMHAIHIGGKKIDAGVWFLGLECDKNGDFHLLAMESSMAIKNQFMPWGGDAWRNEVKIPLKLGKGALEETHTKMEIAIHADTDNPAEGGFAIRWGTHELTAAVAFPNAGGGSAEEASAKKEMKEEKAAEKKMEEKGDK